MISEEAPAPFVPRPTEQLEAELDAMMVELCGGNTNPTWLKLSGLVFELRMADARDVSIAAQAWEEQQKAAQRPGAVQ